MAVLLCRCCGAQLEVKQGFSVCKCDYCGVQQTVPILDFDEKALLWERAEDLRRAGEYDRALAVCRQIAELSPEEPDVYWAMVLCRFGVEYVEEPVSHKRVPTINRIQYTSVIDDEDYRRAVSLSPDGDQRRIYILEAQKLEELRKSILSVSLDEKPYDIFICYKETDKSGRRTEDSVLAARLYRALSAEGWRVFFSRVTLESKAGTEYEPYIFAALNSAKIMLVVGTSPDNIGAVWVKNEWSRYLARMTESGEGMLVPLYKGMLKEHLPEEFSHLQAFDMDAPDFDEELLRGIRKVLTKVPQRTAPANNQPADISGLLRRAELFLEDGDFARADELCENALDNEPENPQAYLIKLLAECRVPSIDRLHECRADFTASGNYAKAIRFGGEELCGMLEEAAALCRYERYSAELENAYNEQQLYAIAERFESIADCADSRDKAALAREKAARIAAKRTEEEKERLYRKALSLLEDEDSRNDCIEARSLLIRLGGYRDSAELLKRCSEMISAIDERAAQQAAENEAAEQARLTRRKRTGRIALISGAGAVCLAAVTVGSVNAANSISLANRYSEACEYLENGSYDLAIAEFIELGDYSNSRDMVKQAKYEKALSLFEAGDLAGAEKLFNGIFSYSDSGVQLQKVRYALAEALFQEERYGEAAEAFKALGDYGESGEYALRSRYNAALQAENSGDLAQAAQLFAELEDYSDSAERANECLYKQACGLMDEGEYKQALELFGSLGDFRDSAEKALETRYLRAEKSLENGQYDAAVYEFTEIEGYSNSAERIKECYYKKGSELLSAKQFEGALGAFECAGGYSNSEELISETKYRYAEELALGERYFEALSIYEKLERYKDSAELADKTKYSFAVKLRETGYYDDAIAAFSELGDYSDAAAQVTETQNAKRRDVKQGDVITFGGWTQGKNGEYEPLEWIVLKRDGDKALVTTRYLVDFMPYGALTWKDSAVRSWLNGAFYNGAFTESAKRAIAETTLTDSLGNETADRVFILSCDEAFGCLSKDTLRTDYSEWGEQKLKEAVQPTLAPGESYGSWGGDPYWLRDIGDEMRVCILDSIGRFARNALYTQERIGVRPALWIELGEF